MTVVKLSDIADLQWWVYVRARKWQDVVLLNANDFDESWDLKWTLVPTLASIDCPLQHILQDNDVLLVTKWSRFFSTLYREEFWPSIASTAFVVLRIKASIIIAEYLALLMNEALQSAYFKNRIRGTSLPSLQKNDIANYCIALPALEKQEKIVALWHEYKQQTHIYQSLIEKKHTLMHSLILSSS